MNPPNPPTPSPAPCPAGLFLIALAPPSLIEIVSPSFREKSRAPLEGRCGEVPEEEEDEAGAVSFGGF